MEREREKKKDERTRFFIVMFISLFLDAKIIWHIVLSLSTENKTPRGLDMRIHMEGSKEFIHHSVPHWSHHYGAASRFTEEMFSFLTWGTTVKIISLRHHFWRECQTLCCRASWSPTPHLRHTTGSACRSLSPPCYWYKVNIRDGFMKSG